MAAAPATATPEVQSAIERAAGALGLSATRLPSGAGHDAQDFDRAGYRAAMIFVRNAHGSHNPDEAMDMDDFALGTQLLARFLTN
jgi:N-carbamoyl-L-amino-acid hydrolase